MFIFDIELIGFIPVLGESVSNILVSGSKSQKYKSRRKYNRGNYHAENGPVDQSLKMFKMTLYTRYIGFYMEFTTFECFRDSRETIRQ